MRLNNIKVYVNDLIYWVSEKRCVELPKLEDIDAHTVLWIIHDTLVHYYSVSSTDELVQEMIDNSELESIIQNIIKVINFYKVYLKDNLDNENYKYIENQSLFVRQGSLFIINLQLIKVIEISYKEEHLVG